MSNENEILEPDETKSAKTWMLIAEAWRVVTLVPREAHRSEDWVRLSQRVAGIESRLLELQADLASASRQDTDSRSWSQERAEIEDLIFEIAHSVQPQLSPDSDIPF